MKYVVYIQYKGCPQLRLIIEADCEEAARNIALMRYAGCRVITTDLID